MERVVAQTVAELSFFVEVLQPEGIDTVYFGGGTPSLLPEALLDRLLSGVREAAARARLPRPPSEWTVEANPESLTLGFLQACRRAGVNRLSLGLQSMSGEALRTLGRPGDAEANRLALALARAEWGGQLSLDFLVGIPGQTRQELARDLESAMQSSAGHLSLYSLTPPADTEAGSALARRIEGELQEELWLEGCRRLEQGGYRHYEIANFARPGEECRHNLRYWRLEPYLGVGPGAVSTLPGVRGEVLRVYNPEDLAEFCRGRPRMWGLRQERITPKEFLFETLMLGWRLREGVECDRFERRFGQPLPDLVPALWPRWQGLGYIQEDAARYALTGAARLALNRRLVELQEALEQVEMRQVLWP